MVGNCVVSTPKKLKNFDNINKCNKCNKTYIKVMNIKENKTFKKKYSRSKIVSPSSNLLFRTQNKNVVPEVSIHPKFYQTTLFKKFNKSRQKFSNTISENVCSNSNYNLNSSRKQINKSVFSEIVILNSIFLNIGNSLEMLRKT